MKLSTLSPIFGERNSFRAKEGGIDLSLISGGGVKYVPIDATKKMGKKTSHVVNFIVFMALSFGICRCFQNLAGH